MPPGGGARPSRGTCPQARTRCSDHARAAGSGARPRSRTRPMGGCARAGRSGQASMACPAARADDPASSATPSPAATSSQMLAGLCVSNGMRGSNPAAAAAPARMPRSPLPAGRQHERLVPDVGQLRHAPGERVPSRRGGQHDALGGQRLAEVGGGQVVVDGAERHVDAAGVQVGQEIGDEARAQGDGHPGVAAVEPGQDLGQVDGGQQLRRADPQLPPGHRGQLGQVSSGLLRPARARCAPGPAPARPRA